MPDPKFFTSVEPLSLEDIARIANCRIAEGADSRKLISGVSPIGNAGPDDITFLNNVKYTESLKKSNAGACILHEKHLGKAPQNMALLISGDPYVSYAKIAQAFYPGNQYTTDISGAAHIDPSAKIGRGCRIEAGVFIAQNAVIGAHTVICANSYIDRAVVIGEHCRIAPCVTVSHAEVGNHVILHSGVRIGQDGFGFATEHGKHLKVPQLGRVIIKDNVEIGANSCIDRGAGPDTVIGEGCKIDNLVQIGHNAQLGKGCIIVAQVGVAGSTKLGDYVVLGGQVGVAGHLEIGSFVSVAAQSGVTQDIPAGETYGGYPAAPVKQWHRQTIALKKLVKQKSTT